MASSPRPRTRFTSVGDYLRSQPGPSRAALSQVRKAIQTAVPDADETISYQIPAYTLNGVPLLYFAGWKSHYSLYPLNDALVTAFTKELAPYERSKGTLRMPLSEPVPTRLISRLARFRAKQITGDTR